MDPLFKVKEAYQKGILSEDVYSLIQKRFPITIAELTELKRHLESTTQ